MYVVRLPTRLTTQGNWLQQHDAVVTESNECAWTNKTIENDVLTVDAKAHQTHLETLGFVFCDLPKKFQSDGKYFVGAKFQSDGKYFVGAKLPEGWKKVSASSRNIDIVKPDGQVFARMFVKYGGYDQYTRFTLVD